MTTTTTTIHHLECDLCHADGGTTEGEHNQPEKPVGWRSLRSLDICATCIDSMTLAEYLAIKDEGDEKAREQQRQWNENRRTAGLTPVTIS